MRKELFSNFYSKIKFNEETWCWDWVSSLNSGGYGQFSFQNKTYKSHRMSYMLFKGYISEDKEIDHLCHNRKCCNPEHLRLVSRSENLSNRNMKKSGYSIGKRLGNNADILDKLYIKINIDEQTKCWNYNRIPDKDGYGWFSFDYITYRIHRFSYLLFQGEIPKNHVIDHLCGNRLCCNPEHLEAVNHKENMVRGNTGKNNHQSLKTHCPHGHEYTDFNTYMNPKGSRECRTCKSNNRKKDNELNKDKYKKYWSDRYLKNRGELKGNSRKTHCTKGHEYTPENTSISTSGSRRCKQCNRDRAKISGTGQMVK